MQPIHLKLLAWIAAATFAATLYANGESVTWEWVRAVSVPVLVLSGVYWLFDRYLWRVRLLHGWLVKRPDLNGIWPVTFRSTWVDPDTQAPVGEKTGTIIIRQTHSTVTFRVETAESDGSLIASELLIEVDGTYRFCGSYLNEPKPEFRSKSQMHYGTFLLKIEDAGTSTPKLRGAYWTDRKTTGEMSAVRQNPPARWYNALFS
jgi:hypothetical protein